MSSSHVNDFAWVSAVHRLATKSKVHYLRHDILQGLSVAWPRVLTQWEIREANATSPSDVYEPRKLLSQPMFVHPHASMIMSLTPTFQHINIARAVDATSFRRLSTIFRGVTQVTPRFSGNRH